MKGRLFVFEGPDDVGKSTLASSFAAVLRERGQDVRLLSFPGTEDGTLGNLVYQLHHCSHDLGINDIHPMSLQALHVAAHVDVIERQIRPALQEGCSVVLDRFWWSTWVYGRASGVSEEQLTRLLDLEQSFWQELKAQVVFLVERHGSKPPGHRKLVGLYQDLAKREGRLRTVHRLENHGGLQDTLNRAFTFIDTSGMNDSPPPAPPGDLRPARPTKVYVTVWEFAARRQAIFYRRSSAEPGPWTTDPILAEYKFTNVFRAADRVSQYLIRNVIYDTEHSVEDLFFRILLFKLFNKIETWELLQRTFGEISYSSWSLDECDRVLEAAMQRGSRIYSAAYIMASGGKRFGVRRKHSAHLRILRLMMTDKLPLRIQSAKSLSQVYEMLLGYPTFGPFLAFQYTIDLNYSPLLDFDEDDFVVAGPGAHDGISKCFRSTGGLSAEEIIRLVTSHQQEEFAARGLRFEGLWGRPMKLIDVQNVFCEISKYARVRHPDVAGVAGRTRIKQRFSPLDIPIAPYYPPKWDLAKAIGTWHQTAQPHNPMLFPNLDHRGGK